MKIAITIFDRVTALDDQLAVIIGVVLSVIAGDQAHVQSDSRTFGELTKEIGDQIAAETADTRLGEIHVGGQHRPFGDLQDDMRERLVDGEDSRAESPGASATTMSKPE